jgi:hypothetical protein
MQPDAQDKRARRCQAVGLAVVFVAGLGFMRATAEAQDRSSSSVLTASQQTTGQATEGADAGELDAGTDPSKSSRRINLYHEYYKIQNGAAFNTTTAQLVFPILAGGGNLQLKLPFTYAELPEERPFGIGDISVNVILLPTRWESLKGHWTHARVTPFFGIETFIPSADSTLRIDPESSHVTTLSQGTGKYRVNAMGGVAWALSREWLIIPLYSQETSFAGDPAFQEISQGKVRVFVQYQHRSGFYIKPEIQWVIDFEDDNRLDWYIAPEVGQVLRGGTVFYIKPGFGLVAAPNNRDWGLEFGIRQKF